MNRGEKLKQRLKFEKKGYVEEKTCQCMHTYIRSYLQSVKLMIDVKHLNT